jgi:hypothetical protein
MLSKERHQTATGPDRLIKFYITMSQRTLRQTNDEDRVALKNAMEIDEMGF